MPVVDLLFPVRGGPVPIDHGYPLFSALSARIEGLHERRDIGVFNLRGTRTERDALDLDTGTLRLRCTTEVLPLLLPLSGSTLEIAGTKVRLDFPTVRPLTKPASLSARVVTFKHSLDDQSFHAAASKFLAELDCSGQLHVGRRRVVSIAGKKVVGFALDVSGLSSACSLRLQEQGLGGRRHMGCGLFLPARLRGVVGSRQERRQQESP